MGTDLTVEEHLAGLETAVERLASAALAAGLDASVPTCPGWTVRQLVAHQGMVHRWALAHVTGDAHTARNPDPLEQEGLSHADPVTWLREGGARLASAIDAAPDDLEAFVFLRNAPPPRQFWARRQCHETTVHAVDGLAARLGRPPTAEEASIPRALALDGIDELVIGFMTRKSSRLRSDQPRRIALRPNISQGTWLLEVSREPMVTTRHTSEELLDADATMTGSPTGLYLALWNRGDEIETDDPATMAWWRQHAQVTWS